MQPVESIIQPFYQTSYLNSIDRKMVLQTSLFWGVTVVFNTLKDEFMHIIIVAS